MSKTHSPTAAVTQFKDQLSSEKRKLSFLFGAGTSMSVGIPGVTELTTKIGASFTGKTKTAFDALTKECGMNIEDILNKLRVIRELIGDSDSTEFFNVKGKVFGYELDMAICSTISNLVSKSAASSIEPQINFSNWLFRYQANRVNPVEVFTTNYDLLFEEAFEEKKVPYFDGFVGSINPFLVPESVEADNTRLNSHIYIPAGWLRLWKIHGSINWYMYKDSKNKNRITRNTNKTCKAGDELMIYPSRQKYDESRRLPFLVFQDRLRKFLSSGEILLIIHGYSFSDEHINEIIFQALRANRRLAITAFIYGDDKGKRVVDETILSYGADYPNLTILGPDKACIGSNVASWKFDGTPGPEDIYWDASSFLNLGDFICFTNYLKRHFNISD